MGKYDAMTDEDFDRLLLVAMKDDGMGNVLTIPGVYECVSEHYNNEVLDKWEYEQQREGKA